MVIGQKQSVISNWKRIRTDVAELQVLTVSGHSVRNKKFILDDVSERAFGPSKIPDADCKQQRCGRDRHEEAR